MRSLTAIRDDIARLSIGNTREGTLEKLVEELADHIAHLEQKMPPPRALLDDIPWYRKDGQD